MYIEQLKNNKNSLLLYLPFSVGFLGFMLINILYTINSEADADELIQMLIHQIGKTPTFVFLLLPLAVLLFILLGWVKIVHKQSIRSLTTARPKNGLETCIFFLFPLVNFSHHQRIDWVLVVARRLSNHFSLGTICRIGHLQFITRAFTNKF